MLCSACLSFGLALTVSHLGDVPVAWLCTNVWDCPEAGRSIRSGRDGEAARTHVNGEATA